jgi:hypothetical protein
MEEQFNIIQVDPQQFELQVYSQKDSDLISTFEIKESFNSETDYVELFVYDANKELLIGLGQNEYDSYRIYNNNLAIDPGADLQSLGYYTGQYYTVYNFLTNLLGSSENNFFYISEISSDRTEVRLDTNLIQSAALQAGVNSILANINNSSFYYDFYLNLGNNQLVIANNIQLDATIPDNPTVLIKLYEPLPQSFDLNDIAWVVENLAENVAYSIEITSIFDTVEQGVALRGPNFNIATQAQQANTTIQSSLASLVATNSTQGSASFQYKLNSLLQEKGIEINIDYSDYSNFIHFSSAQTRLENFYYKLSLVEQYQLSASLVTNTNTYTSASNGLWQNKINSIITNFDGYEYYLYYESASTAWPKTNTEPPYVNYSTVSQEGQDWLLGQLTSASAYDDRNKDYLVYAIPEYIREDPTNEQFNLFIEMIGQHFDIVWTYTKDVTQKFNADNRLDFGVSKDLIADILRDLGVGIYENNFSSQNIYSALLGVTPESSLLNIPNTSLTLPAPTGWEYVNEYVLATPTSSLLPLDDVNKEIYKRIYHNLPYLLKKKGTTAGLRTLINLYGIPDTILRINEFGGQDRKNVDDWDNWQDTFNYSFHITDIDQSVYTPAVLYPSSIPNTIMVRVKSPKLSEVVSPEVIPTPFTNNIMLMCSNTPVTGEPVEFYSALVVEYTGSGLTSGSYSGSIYDPYYQYATVKWIPNISYPQYSASAYVPFYNEDWWSIMVTVNPDINNYVYTSSLYVKQKGNSQGASYIRYEQSQQILQPNDGLAPWETIITPYPHTFFIGDTQVNSVGATLRNVQELRYYGTVVSESIFDDYVMNPYSIESNQISGSQSSYNSLRFRAPLGSDLDITSPATKTSTHPSITGSNTSTPTASFSDGSSTYASYKFNYQENQEYIYQKQPNAGIKIAISDKVKPTSIDQPVGSVLSAFTSIQQNYAVSQSYTKDINYVEVAFSPQDEINDDIIDQLGYFNMGEYIGDPRFQSSSNTSYTDLNNLRDQYFQKYTKNYNITDYFRLIKFFDNSLFKMVKDYIPARTQLAAGAVVKQHLLERNRYRTPQADWENQTYSGSVTSLSSGYATGSRIYTFTGSTGGTLPYLTSFTSSGYYPPFINISQSWNEQVITPSGSTTITHNNLEEFYTGEFEGTTITVSNGSLIDEDCEIFLDVNVAETNYIPVLYNYTTTSESIYLSNVVPLSGEISIYYTRDFITEGSPGRPSSIID